MRVSPCDYRGEGVERGGRVWFACSHPKVAREVLAHECAECRWSRWDVEAFRQLYKAGDPALPTREEYAARLRECDGCAERVGNWCRRAGDCALSRNASKPAFACPLGKFGRVKRG